jgi:phage gp29-like protein
MARRKRRGRPANVEKQVTVASYGQLTTWPIRNRNILEKFELPVTDDLLTRKGYQIYREMRSDDQVKACLWFKKLLVTGRAWEIQPYGGKDAKEEDKKIAEFIEKALKDRVNMNRIVREALSALDFGFSVGEIIWEVTDDPNIAEGGPKIVMKDVKFRDPEWLKIDVDVHGNIMGFRQQTGYMPVLGEIEIPADKVLHFAYQSEFQNHYGVSDLRAAYAAWWSKKFVSQFWNIFLERFGQPMMMMKYPMGASPELKAALQSILLGLSTKTDILVPEGVAVELIEATRAGTAAYGDALTYYDVRISRAILVPALLGMGVDVKRGSDSQSRLHLRVLMKVVNDLSTDLAYAINKSIINKMVDFNFDTDRYPQFVFQDYGEYEAVEIADAIREMFNSGILDLDQEDINYARSILGLPLRREGDEDEVLRSMPPPLGTSPNDPNATGAGATQGNNRARKGPSTQKSRRMK